MPSPEAQAVIALANLQAAVYEHFRQINAGQMSEALWLAQCAAWQVLYAASQTEE
jgi:hypothetical protein